MNRQRCVLGFAVVGLAGSIGFAGCDGSANPTSGSAQHRESGEQAAEGSGRGLLRPAGDCIEPACESVDLPPSNHVVRLTKSQWERTMRDLLRLPAEPGNSGDFPPDPGASSDRLSSDAGDLIVTPSHWKAYRIAAEALATRVTENPTALGRILPEAAKPGAGDAPTRIAAFVADFLPRAYRRPVSAAEIAGVAALGEGILDSDTAADPFLLGVRQILAAILQSPRLLYRIELGEGGPAKDRARLSGYELASKLAYALWGTMPDETIIGYARSGRLASPAAVAEVAKEMLADSRAETTLLDFHDKLFLVEHYDVVTRQPEKFPGYYPKFPADAREDVRRTVRDLVIDHPGGVKDLHSSTVAYVNAKLASIYGIDARTVPALVTHPDTFARVAMDGTQRIGVLMHPGWLAYQGSPRDPSLIRRGAYLARHVLCLPLDGPPPAAAGADPSKSAQPTNRKRVEETTRGCGDGCHGGESGVINPLGSSLEGFDSLGQFRTMDGAFPVDTAGKLADVGEFAGAVPLFQNISTNTRAHACYAAQWLSYLNGSSLVDAKPRWLSPVVGKSLEGASVRDIIAALVQTDAFLTVSLTTDH